MTDLSRRLVELLDQRRADGSPEFTDTEVREALPLLAATIVRAFPDVRLPDVIVVAVGEVAQQAGVDASTEPGAIWPLIETWYAGRQSRFLAELERAMREEGAQDALAKARSFASVLGVDTSTKPPGGSAGSPPPEGTVPAGPAARFAALRKLPPK